MLLILSTLSQIDWFHVFLPLLQHILCSGSRTKHHLELRLWTNFKFLVLAAFHILQLAYCLFNLINVAFWQFALILFTKTLKKFLCKKILVYLLIYNDLQRFNIVNLCIISYILPNYIFQSPHSCCSPLNSLQSSQITKNCRKNFSGLNSIKFFLGADLILWISVFSSLLNRSLRNWLRKFLKFIKESLYW